MASVQELVPLFKTAIADVLAANPSDNGDVRFALVRLQSEWSNPERPFPPAPEEPPPEPPGDEAPTIDSVDPASLTVGEAATLTVTGTGYTDSSVVEGDGNQLVTSYVSETELTAEAPGPLAAGSIALTVTTGALTSEPHSMTIDEA